MKWVQRETAIPTHPGDGEPLPVVAGFFNWQAASPEALTPSRLPGLRPSDMGRNS